MPIHALASAQFNKWIRIRQAEIPSVSCLVCEYNSKKLTDKPDFTALQFKIERFMTVIGKSIEMFSYTARFGEKLDYATHHGFITKHDLPSNGMVGVRADLHGDLASLLENLNTFQSQGLLDRNFKCKEGVHLIFLGDYVDRGKFELQVLELLACLRLENPNQVHLLRGNHEDVSINLLYAGTKTFRSILGNSCQSQHLQRFYETLPLSVYISQKVEEGKRQYTHFTHGLFELYIDPAPMLDSESEAASMTIPKKRDFSERILKIISNENSTHLNQLPSNERLKRLKMQNYASNIQKLAQRDKRQPDGFSGYTWGDVTADINTSTLDDPGMRTWWLCSKMVKYYMRICEGEQSKVKVVIRGHEHAHEHLRHYSNNKKVIITTLTIGMNAHEKCQELYKSQVERAYILTVGSKVKEWEKRGLLRCPNSWETLVTDPVEMMSDTV